MRSVEPVYEQEPKGDVHHQEALKKREAVEVPPRGESRALNKNRIRYADQTVWPGTRKELTQRTRWNADLSSDGRCKHKLIVKLAMWAMGPSNEVTPSLRKC